MERHVDHVNEAFTKYLAHATAMFSRQLKLCFFVYTCVQRSSELSRTKLIIITMSGESPFYALIVWVNDTPMTGNVINVDNIVKPRWKESRLEYKEGDTVVAKCPGFGTPEGVKFR